VADEIDRAQELEQQERDEAIRRARIAASFEPRDPAVENECIDCEGPIEPERRRLLNTSRCANCAHVHEAYHRRGRPWT